jgi:hypothetical protein
MSRKSNETNRTTKTNDGIGQTGMDKQTNQTNDGQKMNERMTE